MERIPTESSSVICSGMHIDCAAFILCFGKLSKMKIVTVSLVILTAHIFLLAYPNNCLRFVSTEESNIRFLDLHPFSIVQLMFRRYSGKIIFYGRVNTTEVVIKVYDSDHTFLTNGLESIIMCPMTRMTDFIDNKSTTGLLNCRADFLLANIFETDWPVPKILELRNNIIIQENVGSTLSQQNFSSWKKRINVSIQLLNMAEKFTFGHPELSFYFTDFSVDNIAMNMNMTPILIDLDHVIIADRRLHKDVSIHSSQIFEDANEIVFSVQDICDHHVSDHNYFMVCQHILTNSHILGYGLLENIPYYVKETFPELEEKLRECSRPTDGKSRISAGRYLSQLLSQVPTSDFENY